MLKLPPKIGSWNVPETLTRQVLVGSVAGKYTEKPRFGSTCVQSVTVVGPLGAAVGLAVAVVVAVAVVLPLVAVAVTGACSSRKRILVLPHQCSFASAVFDGDGVAVGVVGPPPKPEQAASRRLDRRNELITPIIPAILALNNNPRCLCSLCAKKVNN